MIPEWSKDISHATVQACCLKSKDTVQGRKTQIEFMLYVRRWIWASKEIKQLAHRRQSTQDEITTWKAHTPDIHSISLSNIKQSTEYIHVRNTVYSNIYSNMWITNKYIRKVPTSLSIRKTWISFTRYHSLEWLKFKNLVIPCLTSM